MKHYNTSLINNANRIFNPKGEAPPMEVADIIMPTVDLGAGQFVDIVRHAQSAVTGGATIYTTPTDKDFYLTSIQLSSQSDATADNTSILVTANIEGVSRRLINVGKLTTTARVVDIFLDFAIPIKIDRGAIIAFANSFTVGASITNVSITGYTAETTKGT